ncbi:hypothetical protein BASA83_012540 [Batrachochytrium salamandrivorans]|nr:hypothetical protein BASA83_012540 [Batrachochytrium salamandrivorans]
MCHPRNHLVRSKEPSAIQCMSSRPPDLSVPYGFMLQTHVKKEKRLDTIDARDIVKKVVEEMISLKQYGILHDDINGKVKLIDFGKSGILPEWEKQKPFPLKSSASSSAVSKYEVESENMEIAQILGHSLYIILTKTSPYINYSDYEKRAKEKTVFPDSNSSKSKFIEIQIKRERNPFNTRPSQP